MKEVDSDHPSSLLIYGCPTESNSNVVFDRVRQYRSVATDVIDMGIILDLF